MENKLKQLLNNSYAPYSNYKVSALLVTNDGREFDGVNVENASYGATICAERVAIFTAIAAGYRKSDFSKLYIMNSSNKIGTPCMLCRQVFLEFFDNDMEVICYSNNGNYEVYKVSDLCPFPFDDGDLL